VVGKEQAQKLSSQEDSLKTLVDDFIERLSDSCYAFDITEAELLEDFVEAVFAQHFLADMAWEQLLQFYSQRGLESNRRRFHHRRCLFHSHAYPELNVEYADAMDEYADDLCSSVCGVKQKRRGDSMREEVCRADLELAAHYYSEAHKIMSLLYGYDNADVMEVMRKFSELQDVMASLPAKSKRLRVRGKQQVQVHASIE